MTLQTLVLKISQLLSQLLVGARLRNVSLAIEQIGGKLSPYTEIDRFGPGKLLQCLEHFFTPRFRSFLAARDTDDAKWFWLLFFPVQMVKSWNQLPCREIAARAEDHDRAGFHRFAAFVQSADQQFIQLLRVFHTRRQCRTQLLISMRNGLICVTQISDNRRDR